MPLELFLATCSAILKLLSLLHPRSAADVAPGQSNGNINSRAQAKFEHAWPSSSKVPDIGQTLPLILVTRGFPFDPNGIQ
ncbi:hypothetical protein TYRP_000171 [Tyrophagus putrescentiae]|nr:hypothetical protein TYRP_000171 [Tyrophagus putrescentiae]